MKKHIITLFLLLVSVFNLQAAITYELNGGITNDYGWMSKSDMFTACIIDAIGYDLGISLSEFKQSNSPYDDLFVFFEISHCQKILDNAKWDWLEEYLISEQEGELFAAQLTAGTASKDWRYAIAAFFFESQYDTSSDYSQAGKDEAYIPAWKHAYDNPTSPKKEWTLNAPYKEGATFEGWYTTANFSGEQVTTVNASTSGTLYAKWQEEEVTEYKVVEDDITNLVINPDAMTLIGGPSTNFEVEVYLILSENYNSNGQRLLSDQSTVMILGMDAIFLDGYAYDIDVATTSAKAVLHVDLNSELYELQLNMNASSQEAFEIVIENAVVDTSHLDNGIECFLQMTAEWTNPRDGLTYPIVVEVPSYNPQATDPYEVLCTVTIGGYGNDVPWFGVAEGYLTIITIGNTVTVTGVITNEWLNFAANVAISGQLPISETPPCDNEFTEFSAIFCNEYNWNGIIYTVSGVYTQAFTTANGCDSIVTLYLIEDCPVIIDPTHQILYTSTDGNIITPYDKTAFGANIISNTYENGQGVILFDAPITNIGNNAFDEGITLSTIILPEGVQTIGASAFRKCTSMQSIIIPEGVTHIGDWAFDGCVSLTSLTIPSTVESFGGWEFIARSGITTIIWKPKNFNNTMGDSPFNNGSEQITSFIFAEGVERIPNHICTEMPLLTSVIIPESVTHIGNWAFWGCTSLSSITSHAIAPPVLEGIDVFLDTPNTHTLNVPCRSLEAYQQSDWAEYFSNIQCNTVIICHGESYTWDKNGQTYTESGTYTVTTSDGEETLKLIVLPEIPITEENVSICEGSSYLYNGQEYTAAGDYTITLQNDYGCDSVVVLHLTIHPNEYVEYTEIACDSYEWHGTTYTTSGDYTYTNTTATGCERVETLHLTINNSVAGEPEFVTLCYGESYVWNGTSYNTSGSYTTTLSNINGCDSLTTLHLTILPKPQVQSYYVEVTSDKTPYLWRGKSYFETGIYTESEPYTAYSECDSIIYQLELTVHTFATTTNKCGDKLYWDYNKGTLTIYGSGAMYDDPDLLPYRQESWYPIGVSNIILSDSITHIGKVAFADSYLVTEIKLPNMLTSLGDGAFSWTGLQSVTIPAGVTTMGEQVFETCNDLRTILYEGNPTTINNQTVHPFIGCTHLDTIITPAALWHCTSANQALEARYGVPHKARYIEVTDGELTKQAMSYIAQNSSALEVLDLTAATNTTLPLGALMNSNRLSYLYLPEQIQTVPEMLAEGCYSLMEIIIPATVTEIGNYAFAGCTNVWRMTVDAVVPPTIYAETFKGIDRNISVIVPAGSEEAYRQAAYWQEFFIENTNSPSPITNCRKLLREDHILILRNGQTYTMMGQPVNIGL